MWALPPQIKGNRPPRDRTDRRREEEEKQQRAINSNYNKFEKRNIYTIKRIRNCVSSNA